jgi:hypothetical protein
MDMPPTPHQWPTREEWAAQQRVPSFDEYEFLRFDPPEFSSAELGTAIQALRSRWKAEGVRLRGFAVPKDLRQQPGESIRAYYQRSKMMSQAERDLLQQAHWCQNLRQQINRVIKNLQNNERPDCNGETAIDELIEPVMTRWKMAHDAAIQKLEEKASARPIDDAAWEEELRRRAEFDRHGAVRIEAHL